MPKSSRPCPTDRYVGSQPPPTRGGGPGRSTGPSPRGRRPGRRPRALRRAPTTTTRSQPDFAELTARAEQLVGETTGLRSLAGPARARVTDRAGWVRANIASFQRLLRPAARQVRGAARRQPAVAPSPAWPPAPRWGSMLGWMSTRVLGQYDLLIIEDENPARAGHRLLRRAQRPRRSRSSSPSRPSEFRLWLALHEVTHRAQFTGVPVDARSTSSGSSSSRSAPSTPTRPGSSPPSTASSTPSARAPTRSRTAASWRWSPPPSRRPCSTRSAGS